MYYYCDKDDDDGGDDDNDMICGSVCVCGGGVNMYTSVSTHGNLRAILLSWFSPPILHGFQG